MNRAAILAIGALPIASSALAAEPAAVEPPVEPIVANEPFVMDEPGSVVDVLDAMDGRDPFDIEISLGFSFAGRWSTIERTDTSGAVIEESAFRETTSLLIPHVEVGLFRDLSFVAELPVALSRAHSITQTAGAAVQPETIFSPAFTGPSRSGPLHLGLGLQGEVFNQARKPALPTWLIGGAVRVPLGESMHACNEGPLVGQVKCADPADVNRNGKTDEGEPAGIQELSDGMARGALGLDLRTVISRRVGYLEPYGGLKGSVDIPVGSGDLARAFDAGAPFPPVVLEASVGTLIIPWENREYFARITFDLRASVAAHTEGTEFSPLYDALGSSAAPSMRETPAGAIPFAGVTRVGAYPTGRFFSEVIWQTSRYVRLSLGATVAYDGDHAITIEDPTLATSRPVIASGAAGYTANDNVTVTVAAKGGVTF